MNKFKVYALIGLFMISTALGLAGLINWAIAPLERSIQTRMTATITRSPVAAPAVSQSKVYATEIPEKEQLFGIINSYSEILPISAELKW